MTSSVNPGGHIPDRGDGTYLNPILGGDYPDPSVLRCGGDYYMTHSSFNYSPGLIVWHSRDLVNWEPACNATRGYPGNVWAPDFIEHEGRFYIYYPSFTGPGNHSNWVIHAPSPLGPWSDPIDLGVGHIDPGHVKGPDGRRYLMLSGGNLVRLTDDGLAVDGDVRSVYNGWPLPKDWVVESFSLEAPKYTYRNGWYYLTVAEGGTAGLATSHCVVQSRSPTPWGPWEHSPFNPLVHTRSRKERWWSRGHGTLVDTPDGQWYVMYHAYEKGYHTLGRQTLLEPLEMTSDGWFKPLPGIDIEKPLPKPAGEAVAHGMRLSDSFRGMDIGLQWRFYEPSPWTRDVCAVNRLRCTDGGMIIEAEGTSPLDSRPLLCIPCDHAWEASVEVSATADVSAGLVLFYNEAVNCGVGLKGGDGRTTLLWRNGRPRNETEENSTVRRIRIVNDHQDVTFHVCTDEGWRRFTFGSEVSGWHHNVLGGFISLRVGLVCCGEGNAVFRDFEYRAL
jgi:xylan 1,4-beta-xylosidase